MKNLDVSNPYQAASPVRIIGNPKPKPKPIRKTRVSGRPSGPPETVVNGNGKEKEKEKPVEEKYSAQAIIEATLPKVRRLVPIHAFTEWSLFLANREANVLVLQLALAKDFPMVSRRLVHPPQRERRNLHFLSRKLKMLKRNLGLAKNQKDTTPMTFLLVLSLPMDTVRRVLHLPPLRP